MKHENDHNRQDGKVASSVRPAWLDDELEVFAILNVFLDKLDKQPASDRVRMPSFKLSQKKTPKLYNLDESADRTWSLIGSLDGLIFHIRLDRRRSPYDAEYLGASLVMISGAEKICRDWLSRPVKKHYQEELSLAIDAYSAVFADRGEALRIRPVRVIGKSADSVVRAFTKIADYKSSKLTLRQLSARCFWGHSKVLDSREDLLHQLYPTIQITPRPVLVHVHLPERCKGVLFIENQDTYIQALAGIPEEVSDLIVVFAAGFRGSAERVRTHDGVSLHYQGACNESLKEQFEAWWFNKNTLEWKALFWGDLDYSGMAILKALRERFEGIQAWATGYEPLIQMLRNGGGHSPDLADKAEQVDPGTTGCFYADQELLPAIRFYGRFVDQEFA